MTVTQFESLLKTHGSAILGFCRHLTGDEVSAQDLYQDTLLKAFSKLAKINCDTTEEMLSAKNYLIGIAVRLYQNQKRRKMNYEASFTDDVEDMLYAEERINGQNKWLYIFNDAVLDANRFVYMFRFGNAYKCCSNILDFRIPYNHYIYDLADF